MPAKNRMTALTRNSSAVPSLYHKETRAGGIIIKLALAIRKPIIR
jgi:hypothetical protein